MKRKTGYLICFLLILLFCFSCNDGSNDTPGLPQVRSRKIIIDTDTGGDDASAIIMAALQPEIDILGITVISGNVSLDQAAKNALMSLEVAGREDAAVYKGYDHSVSGKEFPVFSVFGEDGMGDAGLIHPSRISQEGSAVDFILDTVSSFPDETEIIALGPVTNIAMAIKKDPDTMKSVKRIWVMGTAGFGPGNATPVAEFNTYMDPEAFRILADSGLPITVIGLDTNTENTHITLSDKEEMMQGNDIEKFVATAISGYMEYNQTTQKKQIADLPDPVAMACLIWEDYMTETTLCHADVITASGETFGQVLFYKKDQSDNYAFPPESYNISVVSGTQSDMFRTWFMQTLRNGNLHKH